MAISISPGGNTPNPGWGGPAASSSPLAGTLGFGTPGASGGPTSQAENASQARSVQQSTQQSQSGTYIPDYAESPILRQIAQYSSQMAPQIYQWGMEQFNKNQGNIDTMMRNALSYASPQRIASEMGRAQAGVMQGAEAGRQNAIRDLQSYGIDPSSGRYAALNQASQVMAGAQAAGAGNQQREATTAQGGAMQNAALNASLQNVQTGYGAANAANQFLSTGMQLKFPPLGQTASSSGQSSGLSSTDSYGYNVGFPSQSGGGGGNSPGWIGGNIGHGSGVAVHNLSTDPSGVARFNRMAEGGAVGNPGWVGGNISPGHGPAIHNLKMDPSGRARFNRMADGGDVGDSATTGGFVSNELSPTNGAQTDDVPAQLNAGEFVIPKDVAEWKGQEFFYKLMAQARQLRAKAGSETGTDVGYQNNGEQPSPDQDFAYGGAVGYGAR